MYQDGQEHPSSQTPESSHESFSLLSREPIMRNRDEHPLREALHKVKVSADFVSKNPRAEELLSDTPLSRERLIALKAEIGLTTAPTEAGSLPAASNHATDYSLHAWTRDSAIIGYAFYKGGETEKGVAALDELGRFYASKEQRARIVDFHMSDDPKGRYQNYDIDSHPHIRAAIDHGDKGRMVESDQSWGHNQLDAVGMWLWSTFKMANDGAFSIEEAHQHHKEINPDNKQGSVYAAAVRFLNRIHYWDQVDVGPWEDFNAHKRASSLGICLAACKEIEQFLDAGGELSSFDDKGLREELSSAIAGGEQSLRERIDPNGGFAIENDTFKADSALSFLLYPFNPGLNDEQFFQTITELHDKRMGEIGFTRRDRDDYVGMDYIHEPHREGIFSDMEQPGYKAAEWTLFDPLIAAALYDKFIESGGEDVTSYLLADKHLKRSIAQITIEPDSYNRVFDNTEVKIREGIIPEAYFLDTKEGRWRANENSPLHMSEAAFVFMMERGVKAAELFEQH